MTNEAYMQGLAEAYGAGTLLMDVIHPDVYDHLEAIGAVPRLRWMDFWQAAVDYRIQLAQSPIGNRKLSLLIVDKPLTPTERARIERQRREDVAKKLAVYHYLAETQKTITD